jgi:hypothetical protein
MTVRDINAGESSLTGMSIVGESYLVLVYEATLVENYSLSLSGGTLRKSECKALLSLFLPSIKFKRFFNFGDNGSTDNIRKHAIVYQK